MKFEYVAAGEGFQTTTLPTRAGAISGNEQEKSEVINDTDCQGGFHQ